MLAREQAGFGIHGTSTRKILKCFCPQSSSHTKLRTISMSPKFGPTGPHSSSPPTHIHATHLQELNTLDSSWNIPPVWSHLSVKGTLGPHFFAISARLSSPPIMANDYAHSLPLSLKSLLWCASHNNNAAQLIHFSVRVFFLSFFLSCHLSRTSAALG